MTMPGSALAVNVLRSTSVDVRDACRTTSSATGIASTVAAAAPAAASPSVVIVVLTRSATGNVVDAPTTIQRTRLAIGTPSARATTASSTPIDGVRARPRLTPDRPAWRSAADARERRPSAQPQLDEQDDQAQQRQRAGREVRRGSVERRPELLVDRRRERREPQHLQRAELRQQVQRDEESAAEQGRSQLGKDDAREGGHAPEAQRAGGLLERRVDALQRRGDGQVDEREVRQGDDEDRSREPSTAWVSDTQAYPLTNAGTASGATSRPRQRRGSGTSVRSTSHAQAVAMTALSATPATMSVTVLTSSEPIRGRMSCSRATSRPTSEA